MNVPPLFHSTVTTNTSTTRALPIKVFLHSNNVNKKRASSTKKKTCTSSAAPTKKQNEIRRFRADTTIGFEQLKKEIERISRLENRNLKIASIRYKDEDGDMIAVDSEEEWKEALICVSTLSVCVIEADIETVEVKKQEEDKKPVVVEEKKEEVKKPVEQPTTVNNKSVVVHKGIICDGCQKHGIEGTRYKCAHCPDFDLCHTCFSKRNAYPINHPTHIFVPIEKPIPAHTNVVTHIVWDKPVEKTVEVKPQEKKVEPPKPVVVEPPKPIEVVKPVEQPKPVVEVKPVEVVKPVEQPKPVVEVKPVEVAKPVEKKPVDPALAKYIEILTSMGFDNQDLCVFLLKKHNNNIQRVVDEYLKHQQ